MIMSSFGETIRLWKIYCIVQKSIAEAMGRTKNIVGEFAEQLACRYYKGKLTNKSQKSYDFLAKRKRFQVKSRMINQYDGVQLSDFQNLDFDFLVVIIFSPRTGKVLRAAKFKKEDVEVFAKEKKSKKRSIIITSKKFWEQGEIITDDLNKFL